MVIGANLDMSLIFSLPTGQHVAIHSIDS